MTEAEHGAILYNDLLSVVALLDVYGRDCAKRFIELAEAGLPETSGPVRIIYEQAILLAREALK